MAAPSAAKGGKKKQVIGLIKMVAPAGQANPSPPIGPALGQRGLNIMDFCKAFNDASTKLHPHGTPVPVVITAYADRTFDFIMKTPPATFYIKKAAGIKSGAQTPGPDANVGKISKAQVKEIAEAKMADLSANDVEQAMKIIEGSARSMGVVVEG